MVEADRPGCLAESFKVSSRPSGLAISISLMRCSYCIADRTSDASELSKYSIRPVNWQIKLVRHFIS